MHLDRRLLGWGAFLIIAGGVPLLVRAGLLDDAVVRDWPRLWPLLLVGWGLGLLLRRTPGEAVGGIVSVAVLGVMAGGLIASGFGGVPAFGACSDGSGKASFADRSGSLDGSSQVSVTFTCGALDVSAIDGSGWHVSGRSTDGLAPAIDTSTNRLDVSAPDRHDWFADEGATWTIELPRDPSLDLSLTLNAGDGEVRLDGAHLGATSVTLNAGSLRLSLADVASLAGISGTVNAGTATFDLPSGDVATNLTLNAGSTTVCVPAGTPVRIAWSGTIAANNFDSLGLTKLDDQNWITTGLDASATAHLELHVSANAGSFNLEIGGTCDG